MDRGVPGEAVLVAGKRFAGLVGETRVLEPGVGECLGDPTVEVGVRRLVDDGADVEALEVDRVDSARLDQGGDEVVAPIARRVELEAQRRIPLEPPTHRAKRWWPSEPERDDERHRPWLAVERRRERGPGLPQRKVECRA